MVLVQKELQAAYIGEWNNTSLVYDFTTQNVLTFVTRQNNYCGYGWTSGSGYYSYIQNSSYYRTSTTWSLPNDAFSGTLDMVKLTMSVPNSYSGGGMAYQSTNPHKNGYGLGCWDNDYQNMMRIATTYTAYTYSNGINTLVIDLTAAKMYVEGNASTPISLSASQVTQIRSAWTNKTFYLNAVANYPNNSGVYTYLKKLEISTS